METTQLDLPGPRRDFVGYGRRRPEVHWPDGANVAVSLVVNYEEGSEYSFVFGDEPERGGRRDRVRPGPGRARSLRRVRVRVREPSRDLAARPHLRRVRRRRHGLRLRGRGRAEPRGGRLDPRGRPRAVLARLALLRALAASRRTRSGSASAGPSTRSARTCGERPIGWYSRFAPSVNTRRLLVEEGGFLYDSDAYNDDLPYFTTVEGREHLIVPYNTLPYNDARFIAPSGYSAGSDFVEMCRRGIDELAPRRRGRPGRDDVDRPPPAPDRPGRACLGPARAHRVRARPR